MARWATASPTAVTLRTGRCWNCCTPPDRGSTKPAPPTPGSPGSVRLRRRRTSNRSPSALVRGKGGSSAGTGGDDRHVQRLDAYCAGTPGLRVGAAERRPSSSTRAEAAVAAKRLAGLHDADERAGSVGVSRTCCGILATHLREGGDDVRGVRSYWVMASVTRRRSTDGGPFTRCAKSWAGANPRDRCPFCPLARYSDTSKRSVTRLWLIEGALCRRCSTDDLLGACTRGIGRAGTRRCRRTEIDPRMSQPRAMMLCTSRQVNVLVHDREYETSAQGEPVPLPRRPHPQTPPPPPSRCVPSHRLGPTNMSRGRDPGMSPDMPGVAAWLRRVRSTPWRWAPTGDPQGADST